MFIAHVPAGYLLTSLMLARSGKKGSGLLLWGLFFAVAPDLDLFWFYSFGRRALNHHHYFSHWPLFWCLLAVCAWATAAVLTAYNASSALFSKLQYSKKGKWNFVITLALLNVLTHIALDSVAATCYWLAPFSSRSFGLVTVPAVHSWWVLNFILHWTFVLELVICAAAACLFFARR